VRRLNRLSRALEVAGAALHLSLDPITFGLGVGALWVHKQLQAAEIGHTALHGAYDRLPGAEAFHSARFRWDIPIDEASWRDSHNRRHHGHTNVGGRDPDLDFGPVRLTTETPWEPHHRWQVPFTLLVVVPNFTALINAHVTGLYDAAQNPDGPEVRSAWLRARRKYARYYLRNYVLFPALAGPFFPKVLLGNWLAEVLRDTWSAATIFCGHVGDEVQSCPEGTRAGSRGRWYAMQVEATRDLDVGGWISVLCGGLDLQIEHHLFPKLPPQRLREIAPEVREICERHGVRYRRTPWRAALGEVYRRLVALSRPDGLSA
jgi:linoleoyl-CoA desaturase